MKESKLNPEELRGNYPAQFEVGFQAGVVIRKSGLQIKTVSKRFRNPYPKDTPEYSAFDYGKLEGFSKIPRTWHYVQTPEHFGVFCPKCLSSNLAWSEWEKHIWCNDCEHETDEFLSIFDGPIPVQVAMVAGTSFDKWDMTNQRVLRFLKIEEDFSYYYQKSILFNDLPANLILAENNKPVAIEPVYSAEFSKGEWWLELKNKFPIGGWGNIDFTLFLNNDIIPYKSRVNNNKIQLL